MSIWHQHLNKASFVTSFHGQTGDSLSDPTPINTNTTIQRRVFEMNLPQTSLQGKQLRLYIVSGKAFKQKSGLTSAAFTATSSRLKANAVLITSGVVKKVVKSASQICSTPTTPLPKGRSQFNIILYECGFISFQYREMNTSTFG